MKNTHRIVWAFPLVGVIFGYFREADLSYLRIRVPPMCNYFRTEKPGVISPPPQLPF
jgi:hypothetical protein